MYPPCWYGAQGHRVRGCLPQGGHLGVAGCVSRSAMFFVVGPCVYVCVGGHVCMHTRVCVFVSHVDVWKRVADAGIHWWVVVVCA